jgi:hypothetical protein
VSLLATALDGNEQIRPEKGAIDDRQRPVWQRLPEIASVPVLVTAPTVEKSPVGVDHLPLTDRHCAQITARDSRSPAVLENSR